MWFENVESDKPLALPRSSFLWESFSARMDLGCRAALKGSFCKEAVATVFVASFCAPDSAVSRLVNQLANPWLAQVLDPESRERNGDVGKQRSESWGLLPCGCLARPYSLCRS